MRHLINLLKGLVVGIANIIPGVSGGTMALMLNIYEPLIEGMHNISITTVLSFFKALSFKKEHLAVFKEEMKKIHFELLFFLLLGAGISIRLFSGLMTYMLINFQPQTYGFFFGLIIMSIAVPYKMISKINGKVVVAFLVAIVIIVGLSFLESDVKKIEKEELKIALEQGQPLGEEIYTLGDYGMLMLSGGVAMSTMIMPGISGSFMLLLMGKYFIVLEAISSMNVVILFVFAIGALGGLLLFSRLLNYLLKKYYDITMGFLTGLVIGSLWAIWPFKEIHYLSNGETLMLNNQFPTSFGGPEWMTLGLVGVGMLLVFFMLKLEIKQDELL